MTTINLFLNQGGYERGPTVKLVHTDSCSKDYGTRDWAIEQCDKNNECTHLDDYGCDDENWRYCMNVKIDDFKDSSATGCTLLKKLKGIMSVMCY